MHKGRVWSWKCLQHQIASQSPTFLRSALLVILPVSVVACSGYRPISSYQESLVREGSPDFSFQVLNFFDGKGTRSDFYVAISNENLQFTKEGDYYIARYTVSFRVLADEGTRLLTEKSWTETVTEDDYEATVSRVCHISPRSFSLQPGSYAVVAEITDEASKRTMRRSGTVDVPEFRSSFLDISNIIIGSQVITRSGQEKILPNLTAEMSYAVNEQLAYFELYDQFPGRIVSLQYKIVLTSRFESSLFLAPYIPQDLGKALPDTVIWSRDSTLTTNSQITAVQLKLPFLAVGSYRFEVGATAESQREVRTTKTFALWPRGFPKVSTFDNQIEVLEYIATPEEFKRLRNAETREEKQQRLIEFWSEHLDREEYYKRAEYANRHFSCATEGWRTAFGWAYMVVGPPEEIQLAGRGVERWFYTLGSSRTLRLVFIVRERDFGDSKCKYGSLSLDPVLRGELVARWRKRQ
jgi:GWxTD domain-containing protein